MNNNNNNNNNQTNNKYIIMTMNVPKPININEMFKTTVASIFYTENAFIDVDRILIRMNLLNLDKMKVIIIFKNESQIPDKRTYFARSPTLNYEEIHLLYFKYKEFFTLDNMEYLFEDNKKDALLYTFIFESDNWTEISEWFSILSIIISGGSNTKKHKLSPLHHRLSQFLICLYGGRCSLNEVNKSFNLNLKNPKILKRVDISPRKVQNEIIDFVRSNEMFKSLILNENSVSKIDPKFKKNVNNESGPVNETKDAYYGKQSSSSSKALQLKEFNEPEDKEKKSHPKTLPQSINTEGQVPKGGREFHTSAFLSKSNFKDSPDFIQVPPPIVLPSPEEQSVARVFEITSKSQLSSYLMGIKQSLDDTIDGTEKEKREIQLKFEEGWTSFIEEKLMDDKYLINKYQGKLQSSLISAKETMNIMSKNNYFKKKFPELGDELNKIENLIITYTLCLTFYPKLSYNALAVKIGSLIMDHLYYTKYLKHKKSESDIVIISNKEFKKLKGMSNIINILKLGDFFMNILQQFPHEIFSRKIKLDSYYTHEPYFLEINNVFLDDIRNNIIIDPITLPMLCLPNPWSEKEFGGFLTNRNRKVDVITGEDSFAHKVENKESIYSTVNYFNSLKFGVNNLMLDYLLSSEGCYLLEKIKADDEIQRTLILEVAQLLSKHPFYLTTFADWRGRIYTHSFFISYQSDDLSISLLNFWEGEPINYEGKFYLYIYGANSHNENGISKYSFKDRIDWVKKNFDKIIKLDRELILSAENPFTFTAFCLNMREIHRNPKAIIKTPVFLDATCSGIQHLAALMKDLELGSETNLNPSTDKDKPGDIYTVLLEFINKAINKFGEDNLEYSSLSIVKLTRKHVKAPIMTKVYNVSIYGISWQLQALFKGEEIAILNREEVVIQEMKSELEESLKINKNKFNCPDIFGGKISLTKKEIYKMASIINEQIFVVFPSLNAIYNYFLDVTKLTVKLGIPLIWIAPSGLKITQRYNKIKKTIVPISLFGKTKKAVLRENTEILDKAKQIKAIIPNIIHSLDASHLINLIISASKEKFKPIITVHDCFGTLPNLMGELEHKVKKEFILLYTDNNFLNQFHQRFIQNITDNNFELVDKGGKLFVVLNNRLLQIPSLPQSGKLDIEKISKSKYMIS